MTSLRRKDRCGEALDFIEKNKGYSALNAIMGGNPNVEYAKYKCPKCRAKLTATYFPTRVEYCRSKK